MSSHTQSKNDDKMITKNDVVSKLKDDGDFDKLRLNIIRKLKDHEELRENLRTIVRQSVAINRPGAETMKPRQLSDAIYQEVGDELMGRISDGLWGIIRSDDGMKSKIAETVQSVYDRLVDGGSNGIANGKAVVREEAGGDMGSVLSRANGSESNDHMLTDGSRELMEPPLGFSQQSSSLHDNSVVGIVGTENDCSDEDPDLPPGFG